MQRGTNDHPQDFAPVSTGWWESVPGSPPTLEDDDQKAIISKVQMATTQNHSRMRNACVWFVSHALEGSRSLIAQSKASLLAYTLEGCALHTQSLTCNRTCLEGWGSACLEYLSVLAAEFAWNLSGSLHAWSKDCKCCQQMNLLETELKLEKQSLLPVLMQFQSFCYINFVMRKWRRDCVGFKKSSQIINYEHKSLGEEGDFLL